MMENIDFEEKVDIDDLVFPSKPMEMAEIEINDIKQEPLEEAEQYLALKSGHDIGNEFKLKININSICIVSCGLQIHILCC